MKKTIQYSSIFVLLFFFFQIASPTIYYAYFKINQEEIAEENCENKAKPELECNGQCHLKKTLEKISVSEDSKEQSVTDFYWLSSLNIICDSDSKFIVPKVKITEKVQKNWVNHYKFDFKNKLIFPPDSQV